MTEADAFVDQAVMGLAEPQPMYKALRESTPVFRSPEAVVLSRLTDIEMALKHTELFSSNMDAVDLGNIRPLIPLQIDPPSTRSTAASSIRCSPRARWPDVSQASPNW